MNVTNTKNALCVVYEFKKIKARGGHAAIDFYNGEIMLACTKPSNDKSTWGRGTVPQTATDRWVRINEC